VQNIKGSSKLCKIIVLNPKGGAGKSTIATSLAGYFATTGRKVAIIDMDKQGSSTHWLGRRPTEFPVIHGVFTAPDNPGVPVDFNVTLPSEIDIVIVDTPAGIPSDDLAKFTVGSHAIIVPVMPSEFDIHAASRLIADLLLVGRVSRENKRLGIIANRVKERTIVFKQLMKFLNRLSIPVIGSIRDSQIYLSAARGGVSIHELPTYKARKDLKNWKTITEWLEQRLETPLNERNLLRSSPEAQSFLQTRRPIWKVVTIAALVVVTVSVMLWNFARNSEADLAVVPPSVVDDASEKETTVAKLNPLPLPEKAVIAPIKRVEPAAPELAVDETAKNNESDAQVATISEGNSIVSEWQAEPDAAEVESERSEQLRTPSDEFTQKWYLSGIARAGDELIAVLADKSGSITRKVTSKKRVEGWLLKEVGAGFAVLANDGEEVRLKLSR
jgi:chromosome partitioning protein